MTRCSCNKELPTVTLHSCGHQLGNNCAIKCKKDKKPCPIEGCPNINPSFIGISMYTYKFFFFLIYIKKIKIMKKIFKMFYHKFLRMRTYKKNT